MADDDGACLGRQGRVLELQEVLVCPRLARRASGEVADVEPGIREGLERRDEGTGGVREDAEQRGAGGLVRAYSGAVAGALDVASGAGALLRRELLGQRSGGCHDPGGALAGRTGALSTGLIMAIIVLASVSMAPLGARTAHKMPVRQLQRIFSEY